MCWSFEISSKEEIKCSWSSNLSPIFSVVLHGEIGFSVLHWGHNSYLASLSAITSSSFYYKFEFSVMWFCYIVKTSLCLTMSEQSHQITAQKEYLEHLHVPKKSWNEITKRHKKREKPGQQEQLVHTRLLQHLLVIVLQVLQHLQVQPRLPD